MLTTTAGVLAVVGALGAFAVIGLRAGGESDLEQYVVARDTQSGGALGLSFLASGLGAWILFTPPEVGATAGLVGVLGYAVAVVVPLVILGVAGRRLRRVMPAGHGLTEFVRVRFGRGVHLTVVAVTSLYMLVAVTSELTAAGGLIGRLTGLDPRLAILAVVVVTLVYTAWGGLRASLRTDGWQAWLVLGLLAVAGVAVTANVGDPGGALAASGRLRLDPAGLEAAVTLVIAVVVTTLFHNGYWQRVWAARDTAALGRGVAVGSVLRVLPLLAVGLAGILAAGAGLELGEPPVPFFALLAGLPAPVIGVVVVLGVALVASSVDTLENGLGGLLATEWPGAGLRTARVATVLLMVPATAAAFRGWSVLRLLLIADLLCAVAVVPVLLGLWRRATAAGAAAGIAAGLLGAGLPATLAHGSVPAGLRAVTFPGGAIALGPFAGALCASTAVAVAVSLAGGRTTDVAALGAAIDRLDDPDRQESRP